MVRGQPRPPRVEDTWTQTLKDEKIPGCKEQAPPHEKIKGEHRLGRDLVFTEKSKTAVGAFSE